MQKILSLALLTLMAGYSHAQLKPVIDPVTGGNFAESCTSIMVGKKASTDGSTMTSHTCDGNYRTWMVMEPRKQYEPGARDEIRWGLMKTEEPHDMRGVTVKGSIPAVSETYAFLNTAYPCLNEKQLAIGETTFGGRDTLLNKEGLFNIEELQRIALQRAKSAREAIKLIGALAEQYGYGDAGECLTFADPHEVWQFEIVGGGPKLNKKDKPTAIWAAQRIPDDHVGVSANISRIGAIDFNDPDNFMYSSNLRERSKALGLWDGNGPLVYWKVISGEKPFKWREYFILNALAPSLGLSYDADELPFSVKPEAKVSPQHVSALLRETYEGTDWDMSKNLKVTVKNKDGEDETITSPIANNWNSGHFRLLANTLKPESVEFVRTVSVCWSSYSHVIQCRSWLPDEVGGVAYILFDNPGQSPRIPVYAGSTDVPASFKVCGQKRYRLDAALWSYREANRLAQVSWGWTRKSMEEQIMSLEKKLFEEQEGLESKAAEMIKAGDIKDAQRMLNAYTNDFNNTAAGRWGKLKASYWELFARGF